MVNSEPGTVPFAVTFDRHGNLVVAEAGTNAVATFDLHDDGTITPLQAVPTGRAATCWIVAANRQLYASNAGSGPVSRFASGRHGNITFVDNTATDKGTVDAAVSADGDNLYVQAGANGSVDEYTSTVTVRSPTSEASRRGHRRRLGGRHARPEASAQPNAPQPHPGSPLADDRLL